jgi:Mg2+ and Co2+ transporter CorA
LVISNIRGPRRISLLDDVCFYWTKIATKDEISFAIENPYHSTLFLRNIIASIWMNAIEYIQAILSELETKLWQIEHMIAPELSHAEKDLYMRDFSTALNEVNTMRRRLNWYVAEMKANCEVLGTSPDFLSDDLKRNGDFVAIYHRLVNYQNWAEKLMNVITTQVNLMETKKSIADSKSLARLTILGFFFIPLSFVATFFSMGGDFSVGQSKFWVYFAVSVPLTLLVYVVAFGKWRVWWNVAVEQEWIKKQLKIRE